VACCAEAFTTYCLSSLHAQLACITACLSSCCLIQLQPNRSPNSTLAPTPTPALPPTPKPPQPQPPAAPPPTGAHPRSARRGRVASARRVAGGLHQPAAAGCATGGRRCEAESRCGGFAVVRLCGCCVAASGFESGCAPLYLQPKTRAKPNAPPDGPQCTQNAGKGRALVISAAVDEGELLMVAAPLGILYCKVRSF